MSPHPLPCRPAPSHLPHRPRQPPQPALRATALALLLAAALLQACSAPPAEAPAWAGYAEAELVWIAPSAAGQLHRVAVQRGDVVRAGQPLFTLDADAEALQRQAAAARGQQAQALADDLRKARRPAEIAAIDQQIAQARATLAASEGTLARQRQLVAQGFQSAQAVDALQTTRDRDAARVAELQAQRSLALEAARGDAIAAAAAGARGAEADAALAAWREGQRQRSAPVDAQVYDVVFRAGEWVNAGTPVVALLPPGAVKLRFYVPEPQLATLAVGQAVAVQCDGCPAGLRARVSHVSPQAEYTPPVIYSNARRAKLVFLVEARPEGGALKPGQPVEVRPAG